MIYILVGLAGIIGAILRYYLGMGFQVWVDGFPLGTLCINWIGSFALAWLSSCGNGVSPTIRTVVGTGMIGAFTTFSTFSVETLQLFMRGESFLAVLYILLSLWGGLFFAWLGLVSSKRKERLKEVNAR
jgi:CrcB protein